MFNGRIVKRKWGYYITLIDREKFKVKLLRFYKHKECSQQYHRLRSELWLLLSGKGIFTKGEALSTMRAGHYATVPRRIKHQFCAASATWVLELQYGEKCDEQDIVRL